MIRDIEIRHFHMACGLGGGAAGFNRGEARVGQARAKFRCLGGIDVDPVACANFTQRVGVPATRLDLMDRRQYVAFHGKQPPEEWREATPDDIRRAAGGERPHIVFASYPCKGFSGLLPESTSKGDRYQALNSMALRGMALTLEAWADDPVELIIMENVPRIATRGRFLLDKMVKLLEAHGYAVRETVHDCGEIGGLGQSRKRFLLVARHIAKVPPFLYQPHRKPLKGVGEIIGAFPVPGPDLILPMHRMPRLQWQTWVRLAFVAAGKDWRSLRDLNVEDGFLTDYGIVPEVGLHNGAYGVKDWSEPSGTVTANGRPAAGAFNVADPRAQAFKGACGVRRWADTSGAVIGESLPSNGAYAVADPRLEGHEKSVQHGVRPWDQPAPVVTGKMFVGGGPNSVADPRLEGGRFNNVYRVVAFDQSSPAVTGGGHPTAGGIAVADPRPQDREDYKQTKYRVTRYEEAAGTVIAASSTGNGGYAVADPRPGIDHSRYTSQPYYGVVPWEGQSQAVTGSACHDNGKFSVADPRAMSSSSTSNEDEEMDILPAANDRLVCRIRALDGTWHRPFTTLELAALQGLVEPDRIVELEGTSDTVWREQIGNAVPEPAARAIAGVMGQCLLLAWSGSTFMLSNDDVWVRPMVAALSVQGIEEGWRL